MSTEVALATTLVELADTLVDDFDVVDLLTLLTTRCVELLDVSESSLLLGAADGLQVMAWSSESVQELDIHELSVKEGPSIECTRTGVPLLNTPLLAGPTPWPSFQRRAADLGFVMAHALPMRLRGNVIGALNLFQTHDRELAPSAATSAKAMTDVATIAVLQHRAAREAERLNTQLTQALESRIVIEQAKGVIAERMGLGMPDSFQLLRGHARRRQRRLADVAHDLINGTLATEDLDRF